MHDEYAPNYGPLVKTCKAFGIGKTKAFEFARQNLLETFHMNGKRCVYVESVRTLPNRIGKK